jgi:LuxR family maltose regulon positive regulatory protein
MAGGRAPPPAGCRVEAADIVADNATKLLNVGRTYTVTRYIERLGDLVDEHEGLAIVHGWVSFVTGRFAEAERSLGRRDATRRRRRRRRADPVADRDDPSRRGRRRRRARRRRAAGADDRADAPDGARRRARDGRASSTRPGPFLAQANEMAASRPDHFVAAVTRSSRRSPSSRPAGRRCPRAGGGRDRVRRRAPDRRGPQLALAHSVLARTADDADEAMPRRCAACSSPDAHRRT